MLTIDWKAFQNSCMDFFRFADMVFCLWDEKKNTIFAYPTNNSPFCSELRKDELLCKKCWESDNKGLEEVDKKKSMIIYQCHMGLTEAIAPILQDEKIIGYLMLGQNIDIEKVPNIRKNIQKKVEDVTLKSKLLQLLDSTKKESYDKIKWCASVMNTILDYIRLSHIVEKMEKDTYEQILEYIQDHITESLPLDDICNHFRISKSSLYQMMLKNIGTNTSTYIRNLRIDTAKKLLKKTTLPVNTIAEKVGIPDTNYFIRLFKKEVGESPLKYRNKILKNMQEHNT